MKKLSKLLVLILALALTVCAFAGLTASASEPDPVATKAATATIAAKNLSYTGAVQVMYYVSTDAEVDPETQELKVLVSDTTFDGKTLVGVAPSSVEGVSVKQERGNISIPDRAVQYALFYSDAVAPVELRKDIYAVAVLVDKTTGNITYASSELEYSPYLYAMDRFSAQPSENQLALYKALLDYGAAVQTVLIKGDDETTFEEKLAAVGGWADEYYYVTEKTAVNGVVDENKTKEPDYYRPSSSAFTTTRFLDGNGNEANTAYQFANWTSGKEVLKADWLTCAVEDLIPGRQELVKNYTTVDADDFISMESSSDITNAGSFEDKSNVADLGAAEYTGLYYRANGETIELGKYNSKSASSTMRWHTGNVLNVGEKHVVEVDIKVGDLIAQADVTLSNSWIFKLYPAGNTGAELYNITVAPVIVTVDGVKKISTEHVNIGEKYFALNEWHSLRFESEIVDGVVVRRVYADNVYLHGGTTPSATSLINGKMVYSADVDGFAVGVREANQTLSTASIKVDNLYVKVEKAVDYHETGKNLNSAAKFDSAEDITDNIIGTTAGVSVADGILTSVSNGETSWNFKNMSDVIPNKGGSVYTFETDIRINKTGADNGETAFSLKFTTSNGVAYEIPFVVYDEDVTAIKGKVGLQNGKWINLRIDYKIGAVDYKSSTDVCDIYINGRLSSHTTDLTDITFKNTGRRNSIPYVTFAANNNATDLSVDFDNVYFGSVGELLVYTTAYGNHDNYDTAKIENSTLKNTVGLITSSTSFVEFSGGKLNVSLDSSKRVMFKPSQTITGASNGTIYVFETEFTYNGAKSLTTEEATAAGKNEKADLGLAFIGFSNTTSSPHNSTMHKYSSIKLTGTPDANGIYPSVSMFGQTYNKGTPYKIRYEYVVGSGDMFIYHNGNYVAKASVSTTKDISTNMAAFVISCRGTWTKATEASFTFDNTFCGSALLQKTITLDSNNGIDENKNITVNFADKVNIPDPTNNKKTELGDSTFGGWYYGTTRVENMANWLITEDAFTLTAKWYDYYNVTLDPNGGTLNNGTTYKVKYGEKVNLEVPTKDGFVFAGWHVGTVDGKYVLNGYNWKYDDPTSETVLVAEWRKSLAGGRNGLSKYADIAAGFEVEANEVTTKSQLSAVYYDKLENTVSAGYMGYKVGTGKRWYNVLGDLGNKYLVAGHTGGSSMSIQFVQSEYTEDEDYTTETFVYEFDFMITDANYARNQYTMYSETGTKSTYNMWNKNDWQLKFQFTSGDANRIITCNPTTGIYTIAGSSKKFEIGKWYTLRYEVKKADGDRPQYDFYVNGVLDHSGQFGNKYTYADLSSLIVNTRGYARNIEFAIDNAYCGKRGPALTPANEP